MIDLLKHTNLAGNDRNQTLHTRCPGHVTYEMEPSRPCPNCQLVGKPIEKIMSVGKGQKRARPVMDASEVLTEATHTGGEKFED